MKAPARRQTETESSNAISPSPLKAAPERSRTKGDVPPLLLDRYLIERDRQGRPERFYRDHRAVDPMFRDEGRRLTTRQAYPDAISDMMKIAQHRGWSQIRISGDEAFRREAWIQARTLGLDVKGYTPRDRDRQAARAPSATATLFKADRPPSQNRTPDRRLKEAAVVVRKLISDPAAQARLIERVYERVRNTASRQPPGLERDDNKRPPRSRSHR